MNRKNSEGYHDPTASVAINAAFKAEKKKWQEYSNMRKRAQKECLTYKDGCMRMEKDGSRKVCPLKGDFRGCLVITGTGEEIVAAYQKMFPEWDNPEVHAWMPLPEPYMG